MTQSPCPNNSAFATNSSALAFLMKACDCDWPMPLCVFANCAGLMSAAIWFLVLVPQIYRCFKYKSVEGISLYWALMNCLAAFNNTFFVFKLPIKLPFYSYISGIYLSVLTGILLLQYWYYSKKSVELWITYIALIVIAFCIVITQLLFNIYNQLEWLSISLWSIESFAQLFLNAQRSSTHGLSYSMIILTTIGKTTDYINTYTLIMPLQYVIMAYFSSSTAFVDTLQVLWYYGRVPAKQFQHELKDETVDIAKTSNIVREYFNYNHDIIYVMDVSHSRRRILVALFVIVFIMLMFFNVGLVFRTETYWSLCAPIGSYALIAAVWMYYAWLRRVANRNATVKSPSKEP